MFKPWLWDFIYFIFIILLLYGGKPYVWIVNQICLFQFCPCDIYIFFFLKKWLLVCDAGGLSHLSFQLIVTFSIHTDGTIRRCELFLYTDCWEWPLYSNNLLAVFFLLHSSFVRVIDFYLCVKNTILKVTVWFGSK